MAEAFSVVPKDLSDDASTWRDWRDDLEAIGDGVPTIGDGLQAWDFSQLPGASQVFDPYSSVSQTLATELEAGVKELGGIASKLDGVSDAYATTEQENVDAINAATA
jgi:hypothetical protein